MKNNIFNTRQRVYDINFGVGYVSKIDIGEDKDIEVKFKNTIKGDKEEFKMYYSNDGKLYVTSGDETIKSIYPTLATKQYILDGFVQDVLEDYKKYIGKYCKFIDKDGNFIVGKLISFEYNFDYNAKGAYEFYVYKVGLIREKDMVLTILSDEEINALGLQD